MTPPSAQRRQRRLFCPHADDRGQSTPVQEFDVAGRTGVTRTCVRSALKPAEAFAGGRRVSQEKQTDNCESKRWQPGNVERHNDITLMGRSTGLPLPGAAA